MKNWMKISLVMLSLVLANSIALADSSNSKDRLPENSEWDNGRTDSGPDAWDDHYNGTADAGEGSRGFEDTSRGGEGDRAGTLGVFSKLPENSEWDNGRTDSGPDAWDDHYNGTADAGEGSRGYEDTSRDGEGDRAGTLGIFKLPATVGSVEEYNMMHNALMELAIACKSPEFKEQLAYTLAAGTATALLWRQLSKPGVLSGAVAKKLLGVTGLMLGSTVAKAEMIDYELQNPERLLEYSQEERDYVIYSLISERYEESLDILAVAEDLKTAQ